METIKANGFEELEKNPFSIKDVLCLIIDRYVKRYNLTARRINSGYCDRLAEDVMAHIEIHYPAELSLIRIDEYADFHAWLTYRGNHYDSECLEGVENWRNLPIFKREIKRKSINVFPHLSNEENAQSIMKQINDEKKARRFIVI